jgi:lipoic acid synthetase
VGVSVTRKPDWLKVRLAGRENYFHVSGILKEKGLHTICQSARCPNIGACWERRTATFLILGDVCTRDCGFCAVAKGRPLPPDPAEPESLAEAAAALGLRYVVVTSVTRDDLADGGAGHFAAAIKAVKAKSPGTLVEVLIPDFQGDPDALETVLAAGPDVLNHNLEAALSVYPRINRPSENYRRSLRVLARAAAASALTKSGLMVGLGESEADVERAMEDLLGAGCGLITIGQYLRPTAANPPVERYYTPQEFERLARRARELGFAGVAGGPLVRSSYEAERLYHEARGTRGQTCAT